MKKIQKTALHIRTAVKVALMCASSLQFAYAEAQAPTLKIQGYTAVNGAFAKQQRTDNGKGGAPVHVAIGASDLYFTVTGKSANGMTYSYRINFETIPGSSAYVNKNYVEFKGGFGTVQAGSVAGPENSMTESGSELIGGANGIDGVMPSVYNYSAGVIHGVTYVGDTKKSSKIVLYSPEVSGFQLGLAYTPNTSNRGNGEKSNAVGDSGFMPGNSSSIYPNGKTPIFGTNSFTAGMTYKNSIGKWAYALAAVGVVDKSKYVDPTIAAQGAIPVNNAKSYQLSGSIAYDQLKVAAGWIDNGKSRVLKGPYTGSSTTDGQKYLSALSTSGTHLGNAGKSWNLGTSYTYEAYQFAVAYHRTDRKTDAKNSASSDIVCTSVDLNALQGLKFFGEMDLIKTKTNDKAVALQQAYMNSEKKGSTAIGNNSGAVFVVGTKVSF
ncbi:MAG: porin [Alphaproteobacteria bacterium]|nr:porin [Alphaproteobacteria bacterium]